MSFIMALRDSLSLLLLVYHPVYGRLSMVINLIFAARLWEIFRVIISGALSELQEVLGCK